MWNVNSKISELLGLAKEWFSINYVECKFFYDTGEVSDLWQFSINYVECKLKEWVFSLAINN